MKNINTTPDSSSRLKASKLTAAYGDKVIVDNLNLSIPSKKITALIGPNGCGKSTLLKSLARVLPPTDGSIILDGKNILSHKTQAVARKLGFLPQGPVAPEGLTVKELVSQGRFPHQSLFRQWTSADEQAVLDAMSVAKVDVFSELYVDQLSGGQRQRCWIAMVLAQQTEIVLLDEPTTFLDLKIQVELMDLLATLTHEMGRTLVVVLHELNLATAYADYLVMMKDGEVLHAGDPVTIFTQKTLKQVFDLDADVIIDGNTGHCLCVPHYRYANKKQKRLKKQAC